MAKRSKSKAAKIRAALADQPDATAKEVVEALAAQRVKVSAAQVYGLMSNGKPKATGYANLILAKQMAEKLGGVDKARAALDVLAKLL